MSPVDLVINARWILPIRPENTVLEDYALVINNGRIVDLLAQNKVKSRYQAKKMINRNNHILMPGLVNAHTHLAMSYYRGLKDDVSLQNWLTNYIWPAERATVSEDYVYDATIHAAAESIRGGVTCINDHYFYMNQVTKALKKAGLRARLANCIYHFTTPWATSSDECLMHQLELIELLKDEPLLKAAVGPHSPYGVNDQIMEQVSDLAKKHQIPIHMHLQETQKEVDDFKKLNSNKSPIVHYFEKGFLKEKVIAVHMTALDDHDIQIISDLAISVVHCPESNMKLASGVSPVQKLLDLGINVALGTDGSASNNDIDMISEMRSASFLAKISTGNPEALSAETIIEMATINGAKALGLEDEIGSLEVGKCADIITIDLNQPETLPVYCPISQIVYAASRNQVNDVWVNGNLLMEDRKLLTVDEASLYQRQKTWGDVIKKAINCELTAKFSINEFEASLGNISCE